MRLWRERFREDRLAGLYSRHRGRQPTPGREKLEARIIDWTLHRKADGGATQWSTRVWPESWERPRPRLAGLAQGRSSTHRLRRYMASNDPDFEAKAADVIGLYLNPPVSAAVFSVDEKSAIQALDRLDPVLPLSPAVPSGTASNTTAMARFRSTPPLMCARAKWLQRRRPSHQRGVCCLSGRRGCHPASHKEIHIIVDNLSAHKTKRVAAFLAEHPNVTVHYTPTYSSWLNQVEIWFSKIQRDLIARGIFASRNDLKRKIMRYIRSHNAKPKPFKWTYRNIAHRITASVHFSKTHCTSRRTRAEATVFTTSPNKIEDIKRFGAKEVVINED